MPRPDWRRRAQLFDQSLPVGLPVPHPQSVAHPAFTFRADFTATKIRRPMNAAAIKTIVATTIPSVVIPDIESASQAK